MAPVVPSVAEVDVSPLEHAASVRVNVESKAITATLRGCFVIATSFFL